MIVISTCPAFADITLFGDVAVQLLKMMGQGRLSGCIIPPPAPALARVTNCYRFQL